MAYTHPRLPRVIEPMKRAAAPCATPRSRSRSAAGSRSGRAAARRPSTTSTSSSAPRTPRARKRRSSAPGCEPSDRPRTGCSRPGTATMLVDLIFRPSGGPVDDGWLERAEEIEVIAMRLPVASLEDVLVDEAARAARAGAGLLLRARDRPRDAGADRLGVRAGADGGLAVREGVLHARRGARDRRAVRSRLASKKNCCQAVPPVVGASTRIVRPSSRSTPGWKRSLSAGSACA